MTFKKIIIFYPSFERGGATNILITIINFFLKKNVDVTLFSFNADYSFFTKSKNIRIIGSKTKIKSSRWLLNFLATYYLLKFLILNIDRIPIISFQSHIPAIILAKLFNKKIYIRNSEEIFGATRYSDNKFNAILVFFLKIIFYNLADKIIAISIKSKNSLKKIILKKSKVILIYNPYLINNKKFKFKKSKKKFNILCIGRLTSQKNFKLVIGAINYLSLIYSNINFTLVGSGPLKRTLKSQSDGNIKFLNWTKNVKKHFMQSHLFILPSYYEGLPNALIEATYYSVPSIATDCSGVRDILIGNKGGYIVPIDELNKLKRKISFVINNYANAKKKVLYAKKRLTNFNVSNCKYFYKLIIKK